MKSLKLNLICQCLLGMKCEKAVTWHAVFNIHTKSLDNNNNNTATVTRQYRTAEDSFLNHHHQCVYLMSSCRSQDKDGIKQYKQRGGAESARVWAVCSEAQHPAAAQGLHRPAVHSPAWAAHGLPQGTLWQTGEGGCWQKRLWLICYERPFLHSFLRCHTFCSSYFVLLEMLHTYYVMYSMWIKYTCLL